MRRARVTLSVTDDSVVKAPHTDAPKSTANAQDAATNDLRGTDTIEARAAQIVEVLKASIHLAMPPVARGCDGLGLPLPEGGVRASPHTMASAERWIDLV
jgi:hypothetical protein